MTDTRHIWVIDDDHSIRWVLERALKQAGMGVQTFDNADGILELLEKGRPDAIVSDVRMPGIDGLQLLELLGQRYPELPVIIMTAHSDLDSAVSAYQGGAFEYLPKPFDVDEAIELVNRAIQHSRAQPGSHAAASPDKAPDIIGEAASMQEVFRAIGRLARSKITVLITGESGTGKELVAHALHRHSPRADKPFIALNTAAIPRDLLESELFGHERGAFTGAQSARSGRFEQADGGTLFLDEIGDMPAELQTRLLRVLADGEFYRVGGHTPTKVDVRIVAATHQNLEQRVKDGQFREDLFHRLNVIRVHMPPLRDRQEDIPLLARHFLAEAAKELNMEAKQLDAETSAYLAQQEWPGNVRELENICRWLTVMSPGKTIHMDDLPAELKKTPQPRDGNENWEHSLRRWADARLSQGEASLLDDAVPRFERIMIETALKHTAGRRQDAAKLLGWGRNTLTRKIKDLGMEESTPDVA
ncbi:MAG: nitrogen regulation protein NR(I) [Gammaproteobacteria bacterium]|nr:nitrogen regulation protein NR(I) [Gammaproteobacteria bacterium]